MLDRSILSVVLVNLAGTMESLSLAQARRIALAAQGFVDKPPTGVPTMRHLRRVLGRNRLLQIDSVNVVQRAHYMPVYSRLGPYPTSLVDRAAYQAPRVLFECWAHVASLVATELYPLMRWRMDAQAASVWGFIKRISEERPEVIDFVRDEVRTKGPITAAQLELDVGRPRTKGWAWNWSDAKIALEWLFAIGEVTAAGRTNGFAREYDLMERVIPPEVYAAPAPDPHTARRELLSLSAQALGVACVYELRDYFRLPVAGFKTALAELVDAGELIPVEVEGWQPVAYLHRDAYLPRRVRAATLLSPFDPVVWERARTERLFDFHYRIEIYVPAPQRVHGYYVLPFLLGDQLVARVDLKADRPAGVLRVPAAYAEDKVDHGVVAAALAAELRRFAGWLGLSSVDRPGRGDLAKPLAAALRVA